MNDRTELLTRRRLLEFGGSGLGLSHMARVMHKVALVRSVPRSLAVAAR